MSLECAIRRIESIRRYFHSDPARLRDSLNNGCLIPQSRVALAESFLKNGDFTFNVFDTLDVNLFLLKRISPSQHANQRVKKHLQSEGDLFEYDPAKNGQNILKHGLSFRESVSCARNFGTMTVPIEITGEKRSAVFYELNLGEDHKTLDYAFRKWPTEASILVLTIAENLGLRYRLISSRRMSSKNTRAAVSEALRAVDIIDPNARSEFQYYCAQRLSELLRLST